MLFKKESSISFLVFLVLFTQGNIVVKLIGLCFVYSRFLVPVISRKATRIEFFYIILIAYSLISFLLIAPFDKLRYIPPLLLGTIFWIINFLAFKQILAFIKAKPTHVIHNTLTNYFTIILLIVLYQYVSLAFEERTWNPFIYGSLGMSTGDYMMGIFANSSINMIISSFFVAYFASLKQWGKVAIAGGVMLLTTYMSGIVLFIGSIGILIFITSKISLDKKLWMLIGGLFILLVLQLLSPENINYALNNIANIFTKTPPRKIISFAQTFENSISGIKDFLFGEGVGRFSSRVAFIAGGEYVSWYPEKYIYRHPAFEQYHFQLWNNKVLAIPYNDGTANQPFSIYNQMIGEYGLVGVISLFYCYLGYFFKRYKHLTYGKLILISTLGYFLLDYWFEYFSVLVIFEMLMLLNLKSREQEEYIKAEE